jgi:type I restriction enzyme S subunit
LRELQNSKVQFEMTNIKISEICKIIGGKPNPLKESAFDTEGIPFVKMRDLGRYHLTTNLNKVSTFLNEGFAIENGYNLIKKGSILIPRSGSVGLNHRAILGIDAAIVSHICALEVKKDSKIDNRYLYYYLTMFDMGRIAQKTTGLDSITFKKIGNIKIPVASQLEQSKITAHLDKIQELINSRIETIQLLNEYMKSLFFEFFGDPVSNERKWKKKPIKELGKVITGNTPPRKRQSYYSESTDGIDWIKNNNILNSEYYCTESEERLSITGKKVGRVVPKHATLVISISGSKKRLGDCAMSAKEVAFNQQINAFVSKENPVYYYFLLKNSKHLIQNLASNALKQLISKASLEDLEIIDTDKSLQIKFEKSFSKVSEIKSNLQQSLSFLETFFQASLQTTFNKDHNVNEEEVFESILENFSNADFKKGDRLSFLLRWLEKDRSRFSSRQNYNLAWEKLLKLLEDETIQQILEGKSITLKVKK